MALGAKSLFNYGIQITALNNLIDFQVVSLGPTLTATLTQGSYSTAELAAEVALQLQTIDSVNIYSVTIVRNIMGGTQNRMIISTNGAYLSLLFFSGPNVNVTSAIVMGFNQTDYTGSTTYTGSTSIGTTLIPDYIGYSYSDDNNTGKVFGAINVSTSGLKESTTFATQLFIEVAFKYEAKARLSFWKSFFLWAIQQKSYEFIPEISSPDVVYTVTLESTEYDNQGLGYQMPEMLPDYPNSYETGALKFRISQ